MRRRLFTYYDTHLSHATFFILFDVLNNIRLFRTKSIHQHRNLQYNEIQSLIAVHNTMANNNIYLMIIDMYEDLFHAFVKNFT